MIQWTPELQHLLEWMMCLDIDAKNALTDIADEPIIVEDKP